MIKKTKIALPIAGASIALLALTLQLRSIPSEKIEDEVSSSIFQEEEKGLISLNDEQKENAGIEVQPAKLGKLQLVSTFPGKVEIKPQSYTHIVARVTGIALALYKNVGDKVKEGDTLALIDSKEIAELKSGYLKTVRQEKLARHLLQKEKVLYDKKVGAEQDYLQLIATYEDAKQEKEEIKQKLYASNFSDEEIDAIANTSPSSFRHYEIKAPFSGTVLLRNMIRGELFVEGRDAYVIADLNTLQVELGIYPQDIASFKVGDSIEITDGTHVAKAVISNLSPIVDPQTRRIKVIAEIDNAKGDLRPGAFVTAEMKKSEGKALILVPETALIAMDGEHYVFVQKGDQFEKRIVTIGKSDKENVEILSGLNVGEKYVSKNAFILKFELMKGEAE